MTAIEQLAAHVSRRDGLGLSSALGERLALHVADTVGAWIAATATAEGRRLIRFREAMRQPGAAGFGGADLAADLARNCALARLSEVDDIHLAAMTTAGAIVIPGALTIARSLPDREGSDLTAAIVGGYEAMIRLGLAIDGPANLYRGIWPTYFSAPFGIAAVAARLMELDASQTAHALALAPTLSAPGVGHHNAPTTSRWLAVGHAARNGLAAAVAAQSGFTADLKLLDSGFLTNIYGITPVLSGLTEGLGGEPMLGQVSLKPWCAARQTMAATQALREIVAQGVAPDAIVEVRAAVLPPHQKMIDHGVVAGDRASHLTSLQYQMAVAALTPEAARDVGQSPGALAPALQAFMARIKVAGDDALLAGYPSAWPARVTVVTRSATHERAVTHVPGDPARPLGAKDVGEKFHRLAAAAIGPAGASEMFAKIMAGSQDGRSPVWLVDEVNRICAQAAPA